MPSFLDEGTAEFDPATLPPSRHNLLKQEGPTWLNEDLQTCALSRTGGKERNRFVHFHRARDRDGGALQRRRESRDRRRAREAVTETPTKRGLFLANGRPVPAAEKPTLQPDFAANMGHCRDGKSEEAISQELLRSERDASTRLWLGRGVRGSAAPPQHGRSFAFLQQFVNMTLCPAEQKKGGPAHVSSPGMSLTLSG
ncbi:unnamed protein product [Pleuronectes platessa]|uniref:Uncharacterized protein n=1 Tax=Pleuronectes platessa TaxID=8262 RepID=A0A9N7U6V2_PLEPL|nr:unnamed protein product [Pleuronectes platessa]